ncbi:hypothetical protein AK812_SmicGene41720 [Symbiodinium microadriaticum]|uniref:Uncharacterized protein n=1 Tax=Symbiodinium microadriaticum TaxID=2951 RepID=A0A1Q9C5E0_SYMMI|nr:hypothetical protein AK812_SmicGene41720 [Symbiodinium microadriaticum]
MTLITKMVPVILKMMVVVMLMMALMMMLMRCLRSKTSGTNFKTAAKCFSFHPNCELPDPTLNAGEPLEDDEDEGLGGGDEEEEGLESLGVGSSDYESVRTSIYTV